MRKERLPRWIVIASFLGILSLSVLFVGWKSPAADRDAPLPTAGLRGGIGYCVSLVEDGVEIGRTSVPLYKVDPSRRDEFAISTYNAVAMIARNAGRPDLADAAVSLRVVSPGTVASLDVMTCSCSNTIWCKSGPGKIAICGCGGPCGSCEVCSVTREIK